MPTTEYRGQSGTRFDPTGSGRVTYNLKPAADFTFVADPTNYDVFLTDKGAEVLPILARHLHAVGLHGNNPTTGDPSGPLGVKASKGYVLVPKQIEATAFGDKGAGYSHFFETDQGERHWTVVWRRPYKVGGSVQWETDREGYFAFLRSVQADLMPPIDPNVLRALQSSLQSMLDQAKRRGRDREAEVLEAKLAAFDDPKPKRSSKRAA